MELRHAGEVAIRVWVQIWNHYISGSQPWPVLSRTQRSCCQANALIPAPSEMPGPSTFWHSFIALAARRLPDRCSKLSLRLPPSIAGGLPCRSADLLRYHTQFVIEQSLENDTGMVGAVTDLQEFFNSVPRFYLKRLLIAFGIDAAWVTQWITLLDSMKKSVVVSQDFSLPRTSICGIPEGCPFSVAAAVIVGAQLTAWVQARSEATLMKSIGQPPWPCAFSRPGPSESTGTSRGAGPPLTPTSTGMHRPSKFGQPS